MRRPPPLSELIHYPVTGGVCLLAIVASLCNFAGYNIDPLVVNYQALHTEPWRLITTIFPHVNILHLAFNLSWVWVFGSIIETEFGWLWTGILILGLAAGSSAAEYAFAGSGIGLSGVGYGMFGFLWVLSRFDQSLHDVVDSKTVWTFVVWFFFCIALTVSSYMPVANVAHGVGCALGALAGFAFGAPPRFRALARVGLGVSLVLIGLLGTIGRPYVNFTMDGGEALAHMSDIAFKTDDYTQAAKYLEQAVSYRRTDPRWWFNLYVAYDHLGRHDEAMAALRRAPTIDPASRELKGDDLAILGEDALAHGNFREAADLLQRAMKAGHENRAVWSMLGTADLQLGKSDEAKDAFSRADRLRKSADSATQAAND